ncbi:MAG TPA: hypothetical protein ENN88_01750 [Candidatus Coatesbacteria bacterium]|nr:hypothetical protein [Candidatus Coatesbacteria bacterium]
MTVEERLEKVERELAALKADKNAIKAHEFALEDASGRVRAKLTIVGDGAGLFLFDDNGEQRVGLSMAKEGPSFVLFDKYGKQRSGMIVTDYGSLFVLFDENGQHLWQAP